MSDNKPFLDKWKGLNAHNAQGLEWSLFVPHGGKPRTQRQFALYNHYRYIKSLLSGRGYSTAIELGCGRGTIGLYLNLQDRMKVTLLDMEESAIELARRNFEFFSGQADYVVADASDTKLPSNSFDMVVSIGLLEHIPEYGRILTESYRILKPGGVMFAHNIPAKWSVQRWNDAYKKIFGYPPVAKQGDYYRNSDNPEQYKEATIKAGFKECHVLNVNPFPIWTPIPRFFEYPITLCSRWILWTRSLYMHEPLKTNYLFSQGHYLIGYK